MADTTNLVVLACWNRVTKWRELEKMWLKQSEGSSGNDYAYREKCMARVDTLRDCIRELETDLLALLEEASDGN